MLDLHRHFGTRRVWERIEVPKSPTIDVTEIWCHDGTGAPAVESRNISALDLENWLQEPSAKYIHSEDHTRVFRIVWVGVAPTGARYSPSDRDLQRVLSAWGLQDGYDYALSCFAGVSALPSLSDSNTRIFTAAYHPKLALTWSHTTPDTTKHTSTYLASTAAPAKATTNMVIFAQGEERRNLLASLKSTWSLSLITDPMFPALLSSLVLAQDLDSTLEDIKTVVRNVEARTGHHRFSTRRQTRPAAGELGSLSAEMSGCAAKLANGTRKLKVIEALNSFLADHDSHRRSGSPPPIMKSHSSLLAHRAQMQEIDITCTHQRVQIQIGALLHLIAQQDNAIAFETANATRSIAKDSLQDASSMKMLALVAMFFLPGSFVAALFSAPVFDWDSSAGTPAGAGAGGGLGVPTKLGFKLFWAIAVPLTVVTFGLYGMWIWLQKKRMRRRLNAGFA
ncbi:hypothetical protein QBC37DRAFT_324431 [Rhypophila decipiens]|uniref:Uncharacterized protein n=1 Tax=Rhypophila decipiens TaxID=261697 RepID=A0AAN6XYR1_9PEZI|nr:hypothetical protein QBC37DRAFT_324431 [Rhypophila decipiens]